MAPLRTLPGKNAKPNKSILKQNKSTRTNESLFATTKEDKRRIKHAQLMSKVTKVSAPKPKRRRPNKKLVTTLESLAAALPDDIEETAIDASVADQVHVIKRKSIKSRPGAMKRRQEIDNKERDRFAKNLAQMNVPSTTTTTVSAADKMKALRGFISQTLEKRPEVEITAK